MPGVGIDFDLSDMTAVGKGLRRIDRHLGVEVFRDLAADLPRIDSPGLGLGLPLIIRMSARSEIRSPRRGGTEITMRFNVHEQDEAGRR